MCIVWWKGEGQLNVGRRRALFQNEKPTIWQMWHPLWHNDRWHETKNSLQGINEGISCQKLDHFWCGYKSSVFLKFNVKYIADNLLHAFSFDFIFNSNFMDCIYRGLLMAPTMAWWIKVILRANPGVAFRDI